jgi:hypothetical protein
MSDLQVLSILKLSIIVAEMPGKNFLPLLCAALFCRFAGSLRIDNTTHERV